MIKKQFHLILILSIIFIGVMTASAYSDDLDNETKVEKLVLPDIIFIDNPFIPQLPKKDKPVKTKPKEIKKQIEKSKPKPKPKSIIKIFKKSKPKMPSIKITGLIWNSQLPQAIINGQIVNIGDKIGDAQIIDIRQSAVDFSFNGDTVTVITQKETPNE